MIADAALTTFGASSAVVYGMQMLKKSKLPIVQEGQVALNRLVSVGAACISQVGIGWTWNPQAHQLVISGLTLTAILYALWHIFCQFSMQEVVYQAAVNKPVAPSLAQQQVIEKKDAQVVSVTPQQAK